MADSLKRCLCLTLNYYLLILGRCHLRHPRVVAIFPDDLAHLLDVLPRQLRCPLSTVFTFEEMLQRLEHARGPSLFLPGLFLLRRHVLPLGYHARDTFVRVFLLLALDLDRLRLRFKFHARGKAAAA